MQLAAYKKTPPTELNLNTQQVILQTDFITFFPDINNEYVQLFNTKNIVKLCFTCWKKQQKKKRGKKKSKAPKGTDSNYCTSCANGSKNVGKKHCLIHTNCMYSLEVNFDKEESSKWERTKIEVTMRTHIKIQYSMFLLLLLLFALFKHRYII